MEQEATQERYAAHLISNFEAILSKALMHERQRWAGPYKALQDKAEQLRFENMRLNIQVQSHQLESTKRVLWLKRKAELDSLDDRPAKSSRLQDLPGHRFTPPTIHSSRSLSEDSGNVEDETHISHADFLKPAFATNICAATQPPLLQPSRAISRLPVRTQGDQLQASFPDENKREQERVVYCLCGGHEYGLMIQCDHPRCELTWFHAACVNLKEVPDTEEDWFCPACVPPQCELPAHASRQFSAAAVQTTVALAHSGSQTDPIPRMIAIQASQERLLLPHVPESLSPSSLHPSLAISSRLNISHVPPSTNSAIPVPLVSVSTQAPNNLVPETSSNDPLQEQDTVLIRVANKLMRSSRKSLFRSLQPTARKPWLCSDTT